MFQKMWIYILEGKKFLKILRLEK